MEDTMLSLLNGILAGASGQQQQGLPPANGLGKTDQKTRLVGPSSISGTLREPVGAKRVHDPLMTMTVDIDVDVAIQIINSGNGNGNGNGNIDSDGNGGGNVDQTTDQD